MSLTTRISSRFPRIVFAQCRNNSSVISNRRHQLSVPSNYFHLLGEPHSKVVGGRVSLFHHSTLNASAFQRLGFSSVPIPENPEKENSPPSDGGSTVGNNGATAKASGNAEALDQREEPISEDLEERLTLRELVELVIKKEKLLMTKLTKIEKMQQKFFAVSAVAAVGVVRAVIHAPRAA